MTWGIDLTSVARSELVGLGPDLNDAVTDVLMTWLADGPPRRGNSTGDEHPLYEVPVADDYLLAYSVDVMRRRVAVLWIRPSWDALKVSPGGGEAGKRPIPSDDRWPVRS